MFLSGSPSKYFRNSQNCLYMKNYTKLSKICLQCKYLGIYVWTKIFLKIKSYGRRDMNLVWPPPLKHNHIYLRCFQNKKIAKTFGSIWMIGKKQYFKKGRAFVFKLLKSKKMVLQKVLDGHNKHFNTYLLTEKAPKRLEINPRSPSVKFTANVFQNHGIGLCLLSAIRSIIFDQ